MAKAWILFAILVTGFSSVWSQTQTIDRSPDKYPTKQSLQHENERRFACPVGFFRLGRYCYYLSGGKATWREALFNCKDRNSSLAILNKPGKDKILKRYLLGDQFTKLERWIGGIYNWQQMSWIWGKTSEKIAYQNFSFKMKSRNPSQLQWHCIIMDPAVKYKWNAKTCLEPKHYVCEAPAGRRDRAKRREMINDPSAPQNLVKQHKKKQKSLRKDKLKKKKRKNKRIKLNKYELPVWSHGIKLGSRPPMRPLQVNSKEPEKSYAIEGGLVYPRKPQNLDDNTVYTSFNSKLNDFAMEEILLKP